MNKEEAKQILNNEISNLRSKGYHELVKIIDNVATKEVVGESGERYQLEIQAHWDDEKDKSLRVLVSIDNGGWRAFIPLNNNFIISPDGQFVGMAQLTLSSKNNLIDILGLAIILFIALYKISETTSIWYIFFIIILAIIIMYLIFARDKVRFEVGGLGKVHSKIWNLIGAKEYEYQNLTKAKAIIMSDIGAADSGKSIKQFLLFEDGYRLPIPVGDDVNLKIIEWFKENYKITLSIIKE